MTEQTTLVNFRISESKKQEFYNKAQRFGGPSSLLREFVDAFIEDRLTMELSKERNEIYVTRND